MGSAQGKEVDGVLFMEKSLINDLKMGNNSKPGLKFVTVPTSRTVAAKARKQLLTMSEEKSRKILDGTVKIDKTQGEFVGRAGLTYQSDTFAAKQQDSQGKKSFAKSYINEMAKEAVFTDRKRNELNKIWSQIFYEMVYSALSDLSDMPSYSKKCLEELEKT